MLAFTGKRIFIYSVIILLFLAVFTQLIGYFLADENYYYTSNQPLRSSDIYNHLSFAMQAKEGQWLFKNLYSSDKNQPALFFHPLWLVMGKTAGMFNLNIFLIYQIFKFLFVLVFCLVLRRFLREFFALDKNPWLLPFCLFSGGFFTWLIEKDTFSSLYYSPLFALSLILFLLIFGAILKYFQRPRHQLLLIIFSLSLLLFLTHFYDAISLLVVVLAWSSYQFVVSKKYQSFWPTLTIIGAVGLGALYYLYIFFKEPSLNLWALNNVTLLPSWRFLVLGYGALGPLAILGAVKKFRQPTYSFLILWVLAGLFIIFSPVPFNRRFVLGLSIPITILAYQGFIFLIQLFKSWRWREVFLIILPLLIIGNNLLLIGFDFETIKYFKRPQYEKRNHIETFLWMKDHLPKNSVVFANFQYWDTMISGYSGLFSYLAGGYFIAFEEDYARVYWFFSSNQDNLAREQFLRKNNVDYLFYSDIEKTLGDFQPQNQDYLKLIYKNQDAEVYQVIKPL